MNQVQTDFDNFTYYNKRFISISFYSNLAYSNHKNLLTILFRKLSKLVKCVRMALQIIKSYLFQKIDPTCMYFISLENLLIIIMQKSILN